MPDPLHAVWDQGEDNSTFSLYWAPLHAQKKKTAHMVA